MIGILDNAMGNLRSVYNAVYQSGNDPVVVTRPEEFSELSHLIVPGVGHFQAAMARLREAGAAEAIRAFAADGRPVLGICLGMQLLAEHGSEGGESPGLGLIAGSVRPLPRDGQIRVPHVGWNTVRFRREHPATVGLKPERDFYFVHSFAMHCDDPGDVLAVTEYGEEFDCMVAHANVVGFQFHPEKSQANGMRLIENFCAWDGAC